MKREDRVERLHDVLDTEYAIARCFGHLSSLIKNGNIRNRFIIFAENAENNKRLLKDRLIDLGAAEFAEDTACHCCKINPESFSLSGALNLGMELAGNAGKFYKTLLSSAQAEEERRLFKSLAREKVEQHEFLKKEKKFLRKEDNDLNLIDSYCVNQVISKLWT